MLENEILLCPQRDHSILSIHFTADASLPRFISRISTLTSRACVILDLVFAPGIFEFEDRGAWRDTATAVRRDLWTSIRGLRVTYLTDHNYILLLEIPASFLVHLHGRRRPSYGSSTLGDVL